ncbi:hypothetical protein A3F07_04370 [candidate division WWE3 bacterium RIFCSPHIGHO2_12_FULL_38_15]|nr:MAG: hypothetical protein A3F07_04370 [candidate division WWE3 bacterium RIFCSPHIGHO2_12_FULL_38_15]
MTYKPPSERSSGEEALSPQYRNEKLGLNTDVTTEFPNLGSAEPVAKGGEGEVYKVVVAERGMGGAYWDRYSRKPLAVKIFHKREPEGDFNQRLFALSEPAMEVATTARWVDSIYEPEEILSLLNRNQYQLEQMGFAEPQAYTLIALRGNFIDYRMLDHRGIVLGLIAMHEAKGLPVPNDLNELRKTGGRILPPPGFKGGMATFFNGMTAYFGRQYPDLELPKRIFPKMNTFGVITDDDYDVDPRHRFSGRFAVSMEWVPQTLESVILAGYEKFARERNHNIASEQVSSRESANRLIEGLGDYLRRYAPLEQLKSVQPMLGVMGAYGLVFSDLKYENIGITVDRYGRNEVVLLDPGTAVKKGTIQDFATRENLPDGVHVIEGIVRNPKQEFENGALIAHPWFDQVAYHKMVTSLIGGGLEAAMQSMRQSYEEKAADYEKEMTDRALRKFGARRT